jgi:D-glycero-D-manno-heptose 1,7-bisphosphate phosphatase
MDLISKRLERLSLKSPRACVFWDRDGTLIEFVDHLVSINKVVLRKGISEVIKEFNKLDVLNIVVTNQPMVSKGILGLTDLEQIHNKIETLLGNQRAWLDEIYFCPHHPDRGFQGEIKELKIKCECRKPDVGMLNRAISDYNINRGKCFFIGDSLRDLECAKKFKIPFLGFLGGEELPEKLQDAAFISKDILEIKDWIVNKLKL